MQYPGIRSGGANARVHVNASSEYWRRVSAVVVISGPTSRALGRRYLPQPGRQLCLIKY